MLVNLPTKNGQSNNDNINNCNNNYSADIQQMTSSLASMTTALSGSSNNPNNDNSTSGIGFGIRSFGGIGVGGGFSGSGNFLCRRRKLSTIDMIDDINFSMTNIQQRQQLLFNVNNTHEPELNNNNINNSNCNIISYKKRRIEIIRNTTQTVGSNNITTSNDNVIAASDLNFVNEPRDRSYTLRAFQAVEHAEHQHMLSNNSSIGNGVNNNNNNISSNDNDVIDGGGGVGGIGCGDGGCASTSGIDRIGVDVDMGVGDGDGGDDGGGSNELTFNLIGSTAFMNDLFAYDTNMMVPLATSFITTTAPTTQSNGGSNGIGTNTNNSSTNISSIYSPTANDATAPTLRTFTGPPTEAHWQEARELLELDHRYSTGLHADPMNQMHVELVPLKEINSPLPLSAATSSTMSAAATSSSASTSVSLESLTATRAVIATPPAVTTTLQNIEQKDKTAFLVPASQKPPTTPQSSNSRFNRESLARHPQIIDGCGSGGRSGIASGSNSDGNGGSGGGGNVNTGVDCDFEDRNLSWLLNFKFDELPHLSPADVGANNNNNSNSNCNGNQIRLNGGLNMGSCNSIHLNTNNLIGGKSTTAQRNNSHNSNASNGINNYDDALKSRPRSPKQQQANSNNQNNDNNCNANNINSNANASGNHLQIGNSTNNRSNNNNNININNNNNNNRATGRKFEELVMEVTSDLDANETNLTEHVVINETAIITPKKPPFTYTELIEYALEDKGELTVSGIYQWISDRFPFYKSNDDRWKNSVRHNLSINPHFRKGAKAPQGAGHLWTISSGDSAENVLAWEHKKQRLDLFFKMEAINRERMQQHHQQQMQQQQQLQQQQQQQQMQQHQQQQQTQLHCNNSSNVIEQQQQLTNVGVLYDEAAAAVASITSELQPSTMHDSAIAANTSIADTTKIGTPPLAEQPQPPPPATMSSTSKPVSKITAIPTLMELPFPDLLNDEDLRKTAGQILNGVHRNVEVQPVNSIINSYHDMLLESEDYLNPINKDIAVHESGLRHHHNHHHSSSSSNHHQHHHQQQEQHNNNHTIAHNQEQQQQHNQHHPLGGGDHQHHPSSQPPPPTSGTNYYITEIDPMELGIQMTHHVDDEGDVEVDVHGDDVSGIFNDEFNLNYFGYNGVITGNDIVA